MIAVIVIWSLVFALIALWIIIALANSGKSRDARKATWS